MERSELDFLRRRHTQARHRLLTASLAVILSSTLFVAFLTVFAFNQNVDATLAHARLVAANSDAALVFEDESTGKETLKSLSTLPDIESAALFHPNGVLLAAYKRQDNAEIIPPKEHHKIKGYRWSLQNLDVLETVKSGEFTVGKVVIRQGLAGFYRRLFTYIAVILAISTGALLAVRIFMHRMSRAVSTAESHLDYLAHTDTVTLLPNRYAFLKELDLALYDAAENTSWVGVIMIDLDDFKIVNDTAGHQGGDEVLRGVTGRIKEVLDRNEVLCRLGGDEFVVIARSIGKNENVLNDIAAKVLAQLEAPFRYLEQEFFLSASAGGSVYPVDAQDAHELMRKADTAMYAAKLGGKNTFASFQEEMDEKVQRRMQLERLLRKAIDREELHLVYQPQVIGHTGEIAGVEALLRWHNRQIGDVSPAEFIPVAEDSGLIIEIGKWVLHKACEEVVEWHKMGHRSLRLAVNLSARQFKAKDLLQDIYDVLKQTGIDPSLLTLEITEGNMMENIAANIDLLQKIQRMGVSVSVDDFGTGYSSLAYLKRFPIDQLKIDRSFVQDVPGEGEGLVNAVAAMSDSLGLSVLAEGVETKEQYQYLMQIGCHVFQGFYFSRPIPPKSMEGLLSRQTPFA